jgi:hypothetical protein
MREKMVSAMPIDSAVVARELWQSEFVEVLAAQLATGNEHPEQVVEGLGSIPLKVSRERLRDYLQKKAPHELGKVEAAGTKAPSAVGTPATGPAAGGMGGRGAGGMGPGGRGRRGGGAEQPGADGAKGKRTPTSGNQGSQAPAFIVGADWLDPGSLVVLKTLSYRDRPKTKHRTPPPPHNNASGKRNAYQEKKAEEVAEKQKQTEMQYEWRDTIEKFVSHWDDRLSAVAEKRDTESGNDASSDDKEKSDKPRDKAKTGGSKSSKGSESKKSGHSGDAEGADSKAKGPSAVPTPSVPLPFALRPSEHIVKEFHLRWPEDLPANLTAAVSEPLVVHYLELEGKDDVNHTATFYRSALSKESGKALSATRDIEDGKWVDILQHDGQRTRSLDVLITHSAADAENKRAKMQDLTVQVLMVEVESFEPEAKSLDKEQARTDRP